jgi:predicted Zn-dependent protease
MKVLHACNTDAIRERLERLPCYTEARFEYRVETRVDADCQGMNTETCQRSGGYVRANLGNMWRFASFTGFSPALLHIDSLRAYVRRLGRRHRVQIRQMREELYDAPVMFSQREPAAQKVDMPTITEMLSDCVNEISNRYESTYIRICFSHQLVQSLYLDTDGSIIEQEKSVSDVLLQWFMLIKVYNLT